MAKTLLYKTLRATVPLEIRKITAIDETLSALEKRPESAPELQKLGEIKSKMKARFERTKTSDLTRNLHSLFESAVEVERMRHSARIRWTIDPVVLVNSDMTQSVK